MSVPQVTVSAVMLSARWYRVLVASAAVYAAFLPDPRVRVVLALIALADNSVSALRTCGGER